MKIENGKNHSRIRSVEEAVSRIRAGGMVIVVDDAARENEGDLVMAAETATPEAVNFMARHARGLICAPLERVITERLALKAMVPVNREALRTAFTVSVDAAAGITTGISAADRARTVRLLADPESREADFVTPGHIFPLRALDGGVLRRAGHTEAAVDLARMAGLQPAGVICEIMNEDGTMARLPDLEQFAQVHDMPILTIAALIEYRREREKLIEKVEDIELPTDFGPFRLHLYRSLLDDNHHLALVRGEIDSDSSVLVRVHSECLTGDVFLSQRCDCGGQLHAAMRNIAEAGSGVLLYMRQEGRGIGLPNKILAYKLQEQGLDTVEANERLGFPADLRDYGTGAQILSDLGVRRIRLMTNNPKKVVGLDGHHLSIVEQVPIIQEAGDHNRRYLETKKCRLGHIL